MIMARTRITNEVIYTEIKNIKQDTSVIKKDHKVLCEQVNINRESIASHKSVIRIIETFLVGVGLAIIGLFFGKYK